ncbi:MAG: FMN-binding glutamate synthase family protein, partial [Saprospiraceae bacterium]|nr:FMN-binding glutamate synthase family protein [Saprospiraceae bacterium]
MRSSFTLFSILVLVIIGLAAFYISYHFLWALVIVLPIVFIGFYDMFQVKHSILRNFPFLGRSRYIAEWMRPKLYQYFIESDTEGAPINRMFRSIIYQRAKKVLDTAPFGTQVDVYGEGYEWMNHSIAALDPHTLNHHPRVLIGARNCSKAYNASILNISAMSYGSLSRTAIEALNGGASIG